MYGLNTPYPKTALNGVSISVNKGTFACIMGTSGSGKTTLINILSTIDEATSGKLLIFDQNIVGLSDKEKANIRKRYMGFIFQDYNLIDSLKVIDNILFSLKLNKKNIINEAEIKQIISSLGIEELLDKYPFECSGGQQQRIAIARALVCKPKILFADEPTGNVDSIRAKQLMEYFTEINRKYGITIVMVTHDCLVASYASEMYYVEDGKIINHIFKGNDSFEKFYNRIARISMQIKL
ncbi:MAG: ABC transporter ATP-binding protein [Thomasclavelia ramosa]